MIDEALGHKSRFVVQLFGVGVAAIRGATSSVQLPYSEGVQLPKPIPFGPYRWPGGLTEAKEKSAVSKNGRREPLLGPSDPVPAQGSRAELFSNSLTSLAETASEVSTKRSIATASSTIFAAGPFRAASGRGGTFCRAP